MPPMVRLLVDRPVEMLSIPILSDADDLPGWRMRFTLMHLWGGFARW
jgi:hypothetical protein